MSIFTGAGVAIITPFHADGSVNYDKAGRIDSSSIVHITVPTVL